MWIQLMVQTQIASIVIFPNFLFRTKKILNVYVQSNTFIIHQATNARLVIIPVYHAQIIRFANNVTRLIKQPKEYLITIQSYVFALMAISIIKIWFAKNVMIAVWHVLALPFINAKNVSLIEILIQLTDANAQTTL